MNVARLQDWDAQDAWALVHRVAVACSFDAAQIDGLRTAASQIMRTATEAEMLLSWPKLEQLVWIAADTIKVDSRKI